MEGTNSTNELLQAKYLKVIDGIKEIRQYEKTENQEFARNLMQGIFRELVIIPQTKGDIQ